MMDEHTEELASAYVLGALDEEETRLFEGRLRDDTALQELVASLREVTLLLGGTSAAVEPPATLKARVLMDIDDRQKSPAPTRPRRAPVPTWLPWAVAAGFAAVSAVFAWQGSTLRTQLTAQNQRVEELNSLTASLRAEGTDLRHTVLALQQSNRIANVRIALLNSQLSAAPKALAVSVWDNDRQSGVIVAHNLKPAPHGKDYQLWIIDPRYATPVDAGVFHVDDAGNVRVEFKARMPIQNANQFAVTLEMQGGVPVPTLSAMVLAGA